LGKKRKEERKEKEDETKVKPLYKSLLIRHVESTIKKNFCWSEDSKPTIISAFDEKVVISSFFRPKVYPCSTLEPFSPKPEIPGLKESEKSEIHA
jgi:hypothetical protein